MLRDFNNLTLIQVVYQLRQLRTGGPAISQRYCRKSETIDTKLRIIFQADQILEIWLI